MSSIRKGPSGGRETTQRLDQMLWDHGTGSRAVKPLLCTKVVLQRKREPRVFHTESLVADGYIFHWKAENQNKLLRRGRQRIMPQ